MRGFFPFLILCSFSVAFGGTSPAGFPTRHESFADAAQVPSDVSLFIHLADAKQWRKELTRRPLGRWWRGLFEDGSIGRAWGELSQKADLEGGQLFDMVFGRQVTLVARNSASHLRRQEGGVFQNMEEWALIVRPDAIPIAGVLSSLRLRHHPPRHGLSVGELPEQQFLIAFDGERLVVGPSLHPVLFDEVLARMEAPQVGSLEDSESFTMLRDRLQPGRIGIFLRHESPVGGWSALSGDLKGEVIKLRMAGKYDHSPFQRSRTKLVWNDGLLEAFASRSLAAFVEPTDIGAGPAETFMEVAIGRPFLCDDLRENPGNTRLIAVGEVEGRRESPPVDLSLPSISFVVEAKNANDDLERRIDSHMIGLARVLPSLVPTAGVITLPLLDDLKRGTNRHINLAPVMHTFAEGMPQLEHISLNWRLVRSECGDYFVGSTHPVWLEETVKTVCRARKNQGESGRWTNCGVMNGVQLSAHLRSYSDQPEALVEESDAASFRNTMRVMSELAAGVKQCRWRLSRPSDNEVEVKLKIILSPPDSTSEN